MSELDFTGYASRIHVQFEEPQPGAELKECVSRVLSRVAVGCVEGGATLIGHIKGIAEIENGEFVTCSAVTHDGRATCRGEFCGVSRSLSLVINVLLYGLDKRSVEDAVLRAAETEIQGKGAGFRIEDLEKKEAKESGFHDPDHDARHTHGG